MSQISRAKNVLYQPLLIKIRIQLTRQRTAKQFFCQTSLSVLGGFVKYFLIGGGGRGLPYTTDGDARKKFQKQPVKVTILGVAPANFIP